MKNKLAFSLVAMLLAVQLPSQVICAGLTCTSPVGKRYYPAAGTASDIAGDTALAAFYKEAAATPSSAAASNVSIASPTSGAYVLGQVFATAAGEPGATSLPIGTEFRYLYASTDSGTSQIKVDLFQYKDSGNVATTSAQTYLSFALNGAAADTIHRTSGSFIDDGFTAGSMVNVSGSSGGTNDKAFTAQTVTAGDLTLILADSVAAEAAGASITITTKELLLRTGSSPVFSNSGITLITWSYAGSTAYTFAEADRILFKWWATKQSGGGTINIVIVTQSPSTQSFIQTTL